MNIIQVVLHDKNVFEGCVVIKENIPGFSEKKTPQNPITNILHDGNFDNRVHTRYIYKRMKGTRMSAKEHIKLIRTLNFIDDKNNEISVTISSFLEKVIKVNRLSDIPKDVIKSLTTTNMYRPKRTPLHWELFYLIHYALCRNSFSFIVRKFIYVHHEFRHNYDLWIIGDDNMTWKLVKVSIASLSLDVSYETYEFTLPMLEDFECPEGFIHSTNSRRWERRDGDKFDSFIGSSGIDFTSKNYDVPGNIQNEDNIKIINNWVRLECGKNVRTRLPRIIQQIIKSCFLSLPLAELIIDYMLFDLQN